MKRILVILLFAIAFTSCDDGNLVIETISFSDVPAQSCGETNNLLFKLNDQESLILNIPKATFTSNPTAEGVPITLDVDLTHQVVYTFYNGKVAAGNICDLIPPALPTINNQWKASSGKIQITITPVKKVDETNSSSRITGYNNNIIFKNITFEKGDGTSQFYETFAFGDYSKALETPLPFGFKEVLNICSSGQVYNSSDSESLTLKIDSALILNEVTPVGSPRIGTIGAVENKLVYRLFDRVLTPAYFCQATDPVSPAISQEWLGKIGGTIEVTTTTNGPNIFNHTIIFKNVTLEKGRNNFQLGDNYKYGELQTIKS